MDSNDSIFPTFMTDDDIPFLIYVDKIATIETIIASSGLPMSIIIVCVGDNNFESMNELDSDGRLLQLNGKKAQRDIVQAVGMIMWLITYSSNSY